MKTILVTGAYGFVGSHIAGHLELQGYNVVKLGHSPDSRVSSEVSIQTLREKPTPDCVINCAGSGSVGKSIVDPYEDFQKNVDLYIQILEYVRSLKESPKVIQLSSAAVYGNQGGKHITEETNLKPESPYGFHKKFTEEMSHYYASEYGLSISIVRFFSVYGCGLRKQILWDACKKFFSQSAPKFYGTGQEKRDFIHIYDAQRLIEKIVEKQESGLNFYNGATGVGTTIETLLTKLASNIDEKIVPSFNKVAREGDPVSLIADISKSEALGWKPEEALDQGLKEYASWFKKEFV